MELADLTSRLSRLTADEMHEVADELARHDSAADEVDAWHSMVAIDAALRRQQKVRAAAHAAYAATQAVRAAAEASRVALPDADVTRIARAAAIVARAVVAAPEAEGELRALLSRWAPLGVPA